MYYLLESKIKRCIEEGIRKGLRSLPPNKLKHYKAIACKADYSQIRFNAKIRTIQTDTTTKQLEMIIYALNGEESVKTLLLLEHLFSVLGSDA